MRPGHQGTKVQDELISEQSTDITGASKLMEELFECPSVDERPEETSGNQEPRTKFYFCVSVSHEEPGIPDETDARKKCRMD